MKKVTLALALVCVLVCVLCSAPTFALADGWDLLHSAIRLAAPSDIENLAAEQGFELSGWGDEGDYKIVNFSLEGIACDDANLYNYESQPAYVGDLSFQMTGEGTLEQPGEAFETMAAALVSRYGEPAYAIAEDDDITMHWEFEDASVYFYWTAGSPPDMNLRISGSGDAGSSAKFPFAPTGAAEPVPSNSPWTSARNVPKDSPAESFSFRNGVAGGMTAEEVIAAEGRSPYTQEGDLLLYNEENVAGLSASLSYQFRNGKLVAALYVFETKGALDLSSIADFEATNTALASKYGVAATDETLWLNDLFQGNPAAQGMAVAIGHLVYHAAWAVQDVAIDHVLSGEENQVYHTLTYTFPIPEEAVPDTTGL